MKLDHIGVAVRSIEPALELFEKALGGRVLSRETSGPWKLKICKVELGGAVIELVEPAPGEEIVSKFLARRGEGLHHISWLVEDLRKAQADFVSRGYRPVWDSPRPGSGGTLVTFLDPKATHGILIELAQKV